MGRVRRRSYSAMISPLPAISAIPAIDSPSGRSPNNTHPRSIAHTSCMYVNGVNAEAGARWNARMKRKWPNVPSGRPR